MTTSPDLFAALDSQLEEIHAARAALDAREQAILNARAELEKAFGTSPAAAPRRGRAANVRESRAGVKQKVAQHHVDAIFDYLKKHKTARQADVAKDLQLNSGTASLALRQLEEDGSVQALATKDRGSVVWEFTTTRRSAAPVGEGRLVS